MLQTQMLLMPALLCHNLSLTLLSYSDVADASSFILQFWSDLLSLKFLKTFPCFMKLLKLTHIFYYIYIHVHIHIYIYIYIFFIFLDAAAFIARIRTCCLTDSSQQNFCLQTFTSTLSSQEASTEMSL